MLDVRRFGEMPAAWSDSSAYMFPIPATRDWSNKAVLMRCLRWRRRCANASGPRSESSGPSVLVGSISLVFVSQILDHLRGSFRSMRVLLESWNDARMCRSSEVEFDGAMCREPVIPMWRINRVGALRDLRAGLRVSSRYLPRLAILRICDSAASIGQVLVCRRWPSEVMLRMRVPITFDWIR